MTPGGPRRNPSPRPALPRPTRTPGTAVGEPAPPLEPRRRPTEQPRSADRPRPKAASKAKAGKTAKAARTGKPEADAKSRGRRTDEATGRLVELVVPMPKGLRKALRATAADSGLTAEEAVVRLVEVWVDGRP